MTFVRKVILNDSHFVLLFDANENNIDMRVFDEDFNFYKGEGIFCFEFQ